jgi:hypothetical protein
MKLQFRLRTLMIVVTLVAAACWAVHLMILNRELNRERDDALVDARIATIALKVVPAASRWRQARSRGIVLLSAVARYPNSAF